MNTNEHEFTMIYKPQITQMTQIFNHEWTRMHTKFLWSPLNTRNTQFFFLGTTKHTKLPRRRADDILSIQ